jgi:hypothetical protein
MAQTTPPTITAAPSPAPQRADRTTFSTRVDAFVTWLITAVSEFGAVATNVYNNAVDAYNNAVSAAASASSAASTAGVTKWISGTSYTEGNTVWSPIDFYTYRRKITGAGATDPSADTTNWINIGTEKISNKDASGGYAGLTLFALNCRNVADTVTSLLTNTATAVRTWTMPDKDGTVSLLDDRGLVLLGSATASNTALINFTDLDTAAYESYELTWEGVIPDATGAYFGVRGMNGSTITDGAIVYANANLRATAAGASGVDGNQAGAVYLHGTNELLGTAANNDYSGSAHISFIPRFTVLYRGFGIMASGSYIYHTGGGADYTNTVTDGISISLFSGNIASGFFKLYGRKK